MLGSLDGTQPHGPDWATMFESRRAVFAITAA